MKKIHTYQILSALLAVMLSSILCIGCSGSADGGYQENYKIIEGTVIEKNFSIDNSSDSCIKINTDKDETIILKFETKPESVSVRFGKHWEFFHNKGKELDLLINVNKRIKVGTYDTEGYIRNVCNLIFVSN